MPSSDQKCPKQERIDILEAELADAAAILQRVLPIGQVKAIGLREVAAGVELLAAQLAAQEQEIERLTGLLAHMQICQVCAEGPWESCDVGREALAALSAVEEQL